MSDKIERAAKLLAEAWRGPSTLEAVPADLRPANMEEAVATQDAMAAAIGEEVVGWKVAGQPGAPVGRVFASTSYENGATLPHDRFKRCFLESELALRLDRDLPPRDAAYTDAEVADACTLVLTVELVGSRLTEGKVIPDTEDEKRFIVADNAAQLGLVVGPDVPGWRDMEALDLPISATVGGDPLPEQPRENRRDPVVVTHWLANELSRRGIGLTRGQIVTTGSATIPSPLPPGQEAVVDYGALGTITLRVATS